jgi:hypothetical protein
MVTIEVINSKNNQIERVYIGKLSNGGYEIFVATRDRWLDYHVFSSGHDEQGEYISIVFECSEYVSQNLDYVYIRGLDVSHTLQFEKQEKDQVSVYFMPYEVFGNQKPICRWAKT